MSGKIELSATVWPQIWVNDNATPAGEPIHFDAQEAMLGLSPAAFRKVSKEISGSRGHDYDELALNSGVIDGWLAGSKDATFYVDVDASEFAEWLEGMGISLEQALTIDEEGLENLRAKSSVVPGI